MKLKASLKLITTEYKLYTCKVKDAIGNRSLVTLGDRELCIESYHMYNKDDFLLLYFYDDFNYVTYDDLKLSYKSVGLNFFKANGLFLVIIILLLLTR